MDFRRPVRVSHSYTQSLIAPPSTVFPLLCPVRECDWVPGWRPGFVISESGFVEQDCVFTTSSDDGEALWYVIEHDSQELAVEMLKIVPRLMATRLRIELEEVEPVENSGAPIDPAVRCRARVCYTHTALSPDGEAEVQRWDEARWREFMEGWESALNEYLARGRSD